MNKEIDASFMRVEKALSTLVSSISTYNPSPQLAIDLFKADQELAQSLHNLAKHQANHKHTVSLRATSAAHDEQLRSVLTHLTSTRAELLSIPSTTLPAQTNPVSYNELLSYAKRIAKFTMPPTYRDPLATEIPGYEAKTPGSEAKTPLNGATPSATPILSNGTLPGPIVASPNGLETHTTALPEHLDAHLKPVPSFVPWPSEEVIRRGAMASIQTLLNEGIDPATFDPEKVAELEAMTREREAEDEERREKEEEERRVEMERRMAGGQRRGTVEERPNVFTGLDMPEDDDDD